jgi:hypothetical protein
MEALLREQMKVQERIRDREEELRMQLHQIPGELAAAGANSFIPRILRGKLTNAALNGGKKLINNFFAPAEPRPQNLLSHTIKNSGNVLSLIKTGLKLFRKK